MPISGLSIIKSTFAFVLIGFAALMSIVGMNFILGERAQSYFEDAISARNTRIAAVELRSAMQTAEASERGFIITGNEIYLAPYQAAVFQAHRHLATLQTLPNDYPNIEDTLQRLNTIIAAKLQEFDHLIEMKRGDQSEEIATIFRTNNGKSLTDELNVFLSGIIARADDRLTAGVVEQRVNSTWLRLVSGIGALVIIAMMGGAAYGITRYTNDLRAARDLVNALNIDLEHRVATRTFDLAEARDRAELLLTEVNHRVANSLSLISSFVSLQSKYLEDPRAQETLAETQDRIFAISLVHRRLYNSSDVRIVDLSEYVSGLLDHLRSSMHGKAQGVSLIYEIEPIELDTDSALNLGIVITELVTNAYKYAYPDGFGVIRVGLKDRDGQVELTIEDDGVGRIEGAPAKGTGLGSRIVSSMCRSLGAEIEYRATEPGLAVRLAFSPKPRRTAGT